ncbi:MAG: restriction endonuclease [Candidatus Odinarchaeota archaeon]
MANAKERRTLREWLMENARDSPVHYREIAEALDRDPASVSASLSIEKAQAEVDGRPAYFLRVAPGLYRFNDLCEGAITEQQLDEDLREKSRASKLATRNEMNQAIASLDLDGFRELAEVILVNVRVNREEIRERERYNNTIVLTTSWYDDGGRAPVVFYAKKCNLDEPIGKETILEIRGALPIYGANQGVLISNGICTPDATREAVQPYLSVPPVHIMDKEIILNVLFESRTGVKSSKVEIFLLDTDFFKHLMPEERKNQ